MTGPGPAHQDYQLAQLTLNWPDPITDTDEPGPVPLPAIIAWETLLPADYATELRNLNTWVRWLITTYDVTASTIPDCWYRHPGIIHDLSHLRSAWLLSRHPEAGVGNAGVDWDRWKDASFQRLQLANSQSCASGNHTDRASRRLTDHTDLDRHLADTNQWLTSQTTWLAAIAGAQNALADAERIGDTIDNTLHTIPDDTPTDQAQQILTRTVERELRQAIATANNAAQQDRELATTTGNDADAIAHLNTARRALSVAIANTDPTIDAHHWLTAVDNATDLQRTVAATINLREHTTTAAAAAQTRHPGIADLLGDDTDDETDVAGAEDQD